MGQNGVIIPRVERQVFVMLTDFSKFCHFKMATFCRVCHIFCSLVKNSQKPPPVTLLLPLSLSNMHAHTCMHTLVIMPSVMLVVNTLYPPSLLNRLLPSEFRSVSHPAGNSLII